MNNEQEKEEKNEINLVIMTLKSMDIEQLNQQKLIIININMINFIED